MYARMGAAWAICNYQQVGEDHTDLIIYNHVIHTPLLTLSLIDTPSIVSNQNISSVLLKVCRKTYRLTLIIILTYAHLPLQTALLDLERI